MGKLKDRLQKERPDDFVTLMAQRGELVATVSKDRLTDLSRYLKETPGLEFNFLSMVTASDYLGKREKRFEVVYSLFSITHHHRIMLKVAVDEDEEVPSLTGLWQSADWQEREIYDMFGIRFASHPNLARILLDDDWVGHPLRKDFPITYEPPEFSHNRDRIRPDYTSPRGGRA